MKLTKENMVRLELRIVHLYLPLCQPYAFKALNGYPLPAGSVDASIELERTSPLSIGDSVVGVALI